MAKTGAAGYIDADWGKGVNPRADKEWIQKLFNRGIFTKIAMPGVALQGVASHAIGDVDHATVILDVTDVKQKDMLREIRKELGYCYDGPVRVSLTDFLQAGGKKEIQKQTNGAAQILSRREHKNYERRSKQRNCRRYTPTSRLRCQHHSTH